MSHYTKKNNYYYKSKESDYSTPSYLFQIYKKFGNKVHKEGQ